MTAVAAPILQRSSGRARVVFRRHGGATRLADLYQEGSAKVRLPKTYDGPPEAVLLNTSGGLTDGDRLEQTVTVEAGATAVVTTQACEKVYRARGHEPAHVRNTLHVGADARLLWMPQETILYANGRLDRRLDVHIAPGGRLLLCEGGILGRAAMGEVPDEGLLRESWDVRADGRLVFAERASIGGTKENDLRRTTLGTATLGGGAAFATVLLAAPGDDDLIARAVTRARDAVEGSDATAGISGWDGRLVARLVAPGGQALRRTLVPLLEALAAEVRDLSAPTRLPKVWAI